VPTNGGLQLEDAGGKRSGATTHDVNDVLARYGARLSPRDLSDVPREQRRLLARSTLTASETAALRDRFLLPRDRLVQLIEEAGRAPQVAGGGELQTVDTTHDVHYPELYLVAPGVDYTRFDRLHVNHATDGTGVDETLQLLSGGGVRFVHTTPELGTVTLLLDCPSPDHGWTMSYSGARPHVASFTGASDGTKILMQIIGPSRWTMDYVTPSA
jgi:hypothetical protein